MNNIQKLLKRQSEWQKKRKSLSWPEKIHRVEAIQNSILQLRNTGPRANRKGLKT